MKAKKVSLIVSLILFFAVAVCSVFAYFTVSKIDVSYALIDNDGTCFDLDKNFNSYCGKNLLFLNTDEIKNSVDNPYFKVLSVDKVFPNKVSVKVKERREVYFLEYNLTTYVLDEDGFVLAIKDINKEYNDRDYISLNLDGFSDLSLEVGKSVSVLEKDKLFSALNVVKLFDLTDCVKTVDISLKFSEKYLDLKLETYSGVKIIIENLDNHGEEKTSETLNLYFNETNDYRKSCGVIRAYNFDNDSGYKVIWSMTEE